MNKIVGMMILVAFGHLVSTAQEAYDLNVGNDVVLPMVPIPGGTYQLGDNDSDLADEKPEGGG